MKRMMRALALAVMFALLMSGMALADAPQVTVGGSAQVSVATDHAVIHLAIRTKAEAPSEAQAENKQRTDAVMKVLTEQCGIPADRIATSSFSIYTMNEYVGPLNQEKQYYQVMHDLSVTVSDIDQTGAVIDAVVDAGANIINYVSFEADGMKEAYDKALKEAFADAKRKAELLAETAGMKLGKLVSVSTVGSGNDIYSNSFRMAAPEEDAAAGATKLAPGTQNTSAYVTTVWELEEKD